MRFNLIGILLAAWSTGVRAATGKIFVNTKALILATDDSGKAAIGTLNGYGIPYDSIVMTDSGYTLPALTNSDGSCKYGVIVAFRQLYNSNSKGSWVSFIGSDQWQKIYDYQVACGVRLVHLGAVPNQWDFACSLVSSNDATESNGLYSVNHQFFLDTDVAKAEFPTANLKNPKNARFASTWHTPGWCDDTLLQYAWGMTSQNAFLYNEPLKLTNPASGTLATVSQPALGVINRYSSGREQMVFFTTFAQWAESSIYMNHIWINWAFRGIIPGRRQVLLGLQVDDLLLPTAVYAANYTYRITVDDVVNHAKWQVDLNKRLAASNPGSEIFLEFGFNGNGAFIYGQTVLGLDKNGTCPISVTYTGPQPVTSLEYAKPPGTGSDLWPANQTYNWPDKCIFYDPIAKMFSQNNTGGDNINGVSDLFALVSHTFTHEGENPITYADSKREITYNQFFQAKSLFDKAKRFSPNGVIPPAITGLHNADAIKAWMEAGINYVVGDNTRAPLRNQQSDRWPVISTAADNGFPGLVIIPRWANRIYYNADGVASDVQEWLDVSPSQATNSMANLLSIERATTSQYLLSLYHDPFMFHQANLRVWQDPGVSVNGVAGPWSLIQMWTESILDEFIQYVNWPIQGLKHDDIGRDFVDRMNRDLYSGFSVAWTTSSDGTSITGFTVDSSNSSWSGEIPVMIPGDVVNLSGARISQYGTDPSTLWVSKFPTSFQLKTPIKIQGTKVNITSAAISLTTALPSLTLPTTSLVGSFPVSDIISAKSTSAASASLSSVASAKSSSASASTSAAAKSVSSTSTAKLTSTSSSSARSSTSSIGSTKASSGSSSGSLRASSTTSSAAASSTATSDSDVSRFLNTLCADSTTAASVGNLCTLWNAFKQTGKIQKRLVLPEGAPVYDWDDEGGHPEAVPRWRKRDGHQSHGRHSKRHQ
ncbi:hypothetical protein TWF225_006647 [Orbilia oligospora]|uniref:Uncharacterized protein n=1 Tax=Orbilia oligospora TaxID=2813651 RepID=A0A7C8KIB6_ORBOL|nr:hypothetical protein TWF751_007956 [Orbilia oligospora]KAF3181606.1 hypothetical protein TWF225_006647 [Orbilia oligospora]KAF3253293.1 hypothetical protein TWF217_007549 [Orbilia oligospora]KAF3255129.1 hypothetical protein TWF128_005937 [Orbilia oligospora]KAF3298299.1 hypothetical protein TWF132_000128 [Orbilia oligospora]